MEERKLTKSCDTLARLNENEHKLFENRNHCTKPLPIIFKEENGEDLTNDQDCVDDSTRINCCNNSSKALLCLKDSEVISYDSIFIIN